MINLKSFFVIISSVIISLSLSLFTTTYGEDGIDDPFAPYENGIPEGYKVIEGDILVPEVEEEGTFEATYWTNGIVPYQFDSNVNNTNRNRAIAAMGEWEAVANVDFIPRNGQGNYIHIQNSTKNNSEVGMKGGRQVINIVSWGSRFIIAHELSHALGCWHEQSRPDRDTFLTINTDRIKSGESHNFDKRSSADVYGEHDFDSVMHYGQCAFSDCSSCSSNPSSCRTITVKAPWNSTWQSAIGQRNHLSELDVLTMSFLYPENKWRFVNGSYSLAPRKRVFFSPQPGTFFFPAFTINHGVSVVPAGGTLIIQPGNYNETGSFSKAMSLRAPLGSVTIGG